MPMQPLNPIRLPRRTRYMLPSLEARAEADAELSMLALARDWWYESTSLHGLGLNDLEKWYEYLALIEPQTDSWTRIRQALYLVEIKHLRI